MSEMRGREDEDANEGEEEENREGKDYQHQNQLHLEAAPRLFSEDLLVVKILQIKLLYFVTHIFIFVAS